MSLNESIVEDAALEWFGELGYAVGHGPHLAPGEPAAERDSFGAVVLIERLREAIRRLNPAIPKNETSAKTNIYRAMKTTQGDLISLARDGEFELIVHGCNCFCTMGAGIAKGIKAEFRQAFEADRATAKGNKAKLGTCSFAEIAANGKTVIVVNAYTQFEWRGSGPKVDYGAVRSCMRWIKKRFPGRRIGLPKIGAGLAGGDWMIIAAIIDEELAGEDFTLVEYMP